MQQPAAVHLRKNMKNRKLLYHLLFWTGIYCLWIVLFHRYSVAVSKTMTIEFCYLVFITADFYFIHYFAGPKLLAKNRYLAFGVSIIAAIALSAWLRSLVAEQMNRYVFHTPSAPAFGSLLFISVVNISIWVLAVTIVKMITDRMKTQQRLELLEKENIKNELEYLKAQISPHALFNSLNTIYGHIDRDNQKARDILLQFSELLQYQLYDCSTGKVALEKEIGYIKNYVAFQQLRKDERLAVTLDTPALQQVCEIAPLMLMVLIENAFKHVSNHPDRQNSIVIDIAVQGRTLYCNVKNSTERQTGHALPDIGGIGLANLRRRLELLYPGKHKLSICSDADFFEAGLTIDLV